MSCCAETKETEVFVLAGHDERAPADQLGAKQWRRQDVLILLPGGRAKRASTTTAAA